MQRQPALERTISVELKLGYLEEVELKYLVQKTRNISYVKHTKLFFEQK
jgi:hypothetical protein